MAELSLRLRWAGIALAGTLAVGTVGFQLIGDGRWSLGECAYMTLISATTVGYGESLPGMETIPGARAWASVVILLGVGTFGFAASMFTAFLVESDLTAAFRKKKMRKMIDSLEGHVIVCGVGSTGRHVVQELTAIRTPVLAIDVDGDRLEALAAGIASVQLPYIVGDATDDIVLEAAGIRRAKGIVIALPDDKDNLFVVVSAHGLNPSARIVSRGHDVRVADKLRKAGAHAVVSPNFIGGMRLASEMVRPHVVEFLDEMMRDRDKNLRMEEVEVSARCAAAGKTLREAKLREVTEALVLAYREPGRKTLTYNPGPDAILRPGSLLIVLGTQDAVASLRTFLGPEGG